MRSLVRELVLHTLDTSDGLWVAADASGDERLASCFRDAAEIRVLLSTELLLACGESARREGGTPRRWWVEARDAIGAGELAVVVASVLREERGLLRAYRRAIAGPAPVRLGNMLRRHVLVVRACERRIEHVSQSIFAEGDALHARCDARFDWPFVRCS